MAEFELIVPAEPPAPKVRGSSALYALASSVVTEGGTSLKAKGVVAGPLPQITLSAIRRAAAQAGLDLNRAADVPKAVNLALTGLST